MTTATLIGIAPSVIPKSTITGAVDAWLDDHPEATTTVEDGAITKAKLDSDLSDAIDDVSSLKSALNGILVTESSGTTVTLTNNGNATTLKDNFSSGQPVNNPVTIDGIFTITSKTIASVDEKNPYFISNFSVGTGNWMVGFKYKVTVLDQSIGTPSYVKVTLGQSDATEINNYELGTWAYFAKVSSVNLTRIRFGVYGFTNTPGDNQLKIEIKDVYIYEVTNVSNDMCSYIINKQNTEYTDGTVTYGESYTQYVPDKTLSVTGKAADSKEVGDAIKAIEDARTEVFEFGNDVYIDSSGSPVSSTQSISTDYIDITDMKALSYTGVMGEQRCAHWYDSTKTYIGMSIYANNIMQKCVNALVTAPSGSAFVRLTANKNNSYGATAYYGKNYTQKLLDAIVGDGVTDDTDALQALINCGDGCILKPSMKIKITSSINVNVANAKVINGNGATIIVHDDVYAFNVVGTLNTSANPNSVPADVMNNEAGTIIHGLRITSSDGESGGGIQAYRTFKLTIKDNYIFKCKNGIRVYGNNRDMTIIHNNIYAMMEDGIIFDSTTNLHQCNIECNNIQYAINCLHIASPSAIANFQIVGNDIEISSYPTGYEDARAILFECESEPDQFSEIEICGNSIQGHGYSDNVIRFAGHSDEPIKDVSISGNHISNASISTMYLENVSGIAINGNTYRNTRYVYDLYGSCEKITIIGDVANNVSYGKIRADSGATLDTIICKNCICTDHGSNSINTSDVTNVDID